MEYIQISESDCRHLVVNSVIYKSIEGEDYEETPSNSEGRVMEAYKISNVNNLSEVISLSISSVHWICYPSPGDILRLNISFRDIEKQKVWWFKSTDMPLIPLDPSPEILQ